MGTKQLVKDLVVEYKSQYQAGLLELQGLDSIIRNPKSTDAEVKIAMDQFNDLYAKLKQLDHVIFDLDLIISKGE